MSEQSSMMKFVLPFGLPVGGDIRREITVREMSGHEEDRLAAGEMEGLEAMLWLLRACIVAVGEVDSPREVAEALEGMTMQDAIAAIFAVRRVSYGDIFNFGTRCPECRKKMSMKVDLSEMELKTVEAPSWEYELETPRGVKLVMRVQTAKAEAEIGGSEKLAKAQVTARLMSRIVSFNGEEPNLHKIQDMASRERAWIRSQFEAHEGGIDASIEMTCTNPKCKEEFEAELNPAADGFFSLGG